MSIIMRATLHDRAPNTYYGQWPSLARPKKLHIFAGHCPSDVRWMQAFRRRSRREAQNPGKTRGRAPILSLGKKRKTQSCAGLRFRREVAAQRHRLLLARHARIVAAEGGADLVERDVGEHAAIGEILHVTPAAEIERVVDRIAHAIPVERLEAELVGQLLVE